MHERIPIIFPNANNTHGLPLFRLPEQPQWVKLIIRLVFGLHSTVAKYFCLPRRRPGALVDLDNPPSSVDNEGKLRVFSLM